MLQSILLTGVSSSQARQYWRMGVLNIVGLGPLAKSLAGVLALLLPLTGSCNNPHCFEEAL